MYPSCPAPAASDRLYSTRFGKSTQVIALILPGRDPMWAFRHVLIGTLAPARPQEVPFDERLLIGLGDRANQSILLSDTQGKKYSRRAWYKLLR